MRGDIRNSFLVMITLLFCITLVNANGLVVTSTETNITKLDGVDKTITLSISNDETFSFFNVSFEDESIIKIDKIDELESGEQLNITATIKTNYDFNSELKLIGFYESELGEANETHEIRIEYPEGADRCMDLGPIIKGDKVRWINLILDEITIRNYNTGNDVTTIPEGENYTSTFQTPEVLDYYLLRHGYAFGDLCTIEVLNSGGLIHSSQYDGSLNLDIYIEYESTTIETTFLSDSYKLDFDETSEDIFSIQNTGNKTARNIHLRGDWIIFSENNFNLDAGTSKNIAYTISPIIFETNQTGKVHKKNITIEGNFPTIIKEITIEINYQNLDNYDLNSTINSEIIRNAWKLFCQAFPDDPDCQKTIIYSNGSSRMIQNFSMTQEQIDKLWEYEFQESDERKENEKLRKEADFDRDLRIAGIEGNQSAIFNYVKGLKEDFENNNSITILSFIILVIVLSAGIVMFLILRQRRINSQTKGLERTEKTW